jgi:AraC-like DNA-binding protein/quercetin dioxygenase-like cupin family protein
MAMGEIESFPGAALEQAIEALAAYRAGEDLLYCPDSLAGKAAVRARGLRLGTHAADAQEVILLLSGRMPVATPLGRLELVPGRLLVIDPGVEHGEVFGEPFEAAWFLVQNTNVHLWYAANDEFLGIDLVGRTHLTYVTQALQRELSYRDSEYARSVHCLLGHFSCVLSRRLHRGSYVHLPWTGKYVGATNREWRAIEMALAYCAVHFRQRIALSEIARAAGYSPVHLHRIFTKHTGRSVAEHLRDLRMTHAMDLLANSDLPVREIAALVGYTDPSNFRRAFENAAGVSPAKHRAGRRTSARVRDDGLAVDTASAGRARGQAVISP